MDIKIPGKAVFCGPARNISQYISGVRSNIDRLGPSFDDYAIIIVESDSSDDTLLKLLEWLKENPRLTIISLGNLRERMPLRTMRLATARNVCIQIIELKYRDWDYMVMMDPDNICCGEIKGFFTCWDYPLDTWDVMTANQEKEYYDIWALRSTTLGCNFDCWVSGQLQGMSQQLTQEKLVVPFLKPIPLGDPILVDSAFGGLGVYKIPLIIGTRYVGIQEVMGHNFEIADHVRFHEQLRWKGYKIFINTRMLTNN